jgi:hypothetical protein
MNNIIFVNIIEWNADHSENSKNVFFWNKLLLLVALDYFLQALFTLLHYNAWMILLIFDDIDNSTYHWVLEGP